MRVIGRYDNKSMSLRSAREELLDDKKPMDVYQESIKLNQNKKKAS
jgi:hypothetical protein